MQLTLKAARTNAKYTQREAAQRIGVTVDTISNWERGLKEPSYQALIDLANLFGKTTDYMLGLEDDDKSAR